MRLGYPILLWLGCLLAAWGGPLRAGAQIQALPPIIAEEPPPAPSLILQPLPGNAAATLPAGTLSAGELPVMIEPEVLYQAGPSAAPWTWQVLPEGLLYRNYLASTQEPRLGTVFFHGREDEWLWDAVLGAHIGLLRYGSPGHHRPQGWQLDAEGAAFVRLDVEEDRDVDSTDYRFGFPLTYREDLWEAKFGYYHLCSHIADEYLRKHPDFDRLNYVRDSLVLGLAFRPAESLRLYAEADWAILFRDDGAGAWHFQFGIDYSPMAPTGIWAVPFFAVNTRLQEELDFSGNFTVQGGLQWRGESSRLLRVGVQYFNGMSNQYQFYAEHEEQIGLGVWYDF